MYSFFTKIVGTTYDGRESVIKALYAKGMLSAGKPLHLMRQPYNSHDSNAVAVFCANQQIGFLSRDVAAQVAPKMDNGVVCDATVASVTGGGDLHYGINIKICVGEEESAKKVHEVTAATGDNYLALFSAEELIAFACRSLQRRDLASAIVALGEAESRGNQIATHQLAQLYFAIAHVFLNDEELQDFGKGVYFMTESARRGHPEAKRTMKQMIESEAYTNERDSVKPSPKANYAAYLKRYPSLQKADEIRKEKQAMAEALKEHREGCFGASIRWAWWLVAALFVLVFLLVGLDVYRDAWAFIVIGGSVLIAVIGKADEMKIKEKYDEAERREQSLKKIPPYDPNWDYTE